RLQMLSRAVPIATWRSNGSLRHTIACEDPGSRVAWWLAALLDPGVLYQLSPLARLGLDVVRELLRRPGHRIERLGSEFLLDVGAAEDLVDVAIQSRDRLARRGRGSQHTEEADHLEARQARFRESRQIGKRRCALQARRGNRPQLAVFHEPLR